MFESLHLINRKWISIPQWLSNVLIAIIIFSACEIGRLMSTHEIILPLSIVWPATGFALAGILLFGFEGAYIGIFLGNFINNFYHLVNVHSVSGSFFLALAVALGSVIQALLSGYIICRYCSKEYLVTLRDIFIFLIPAGLLACMVAPAIGVAALYLYGALPMDQIPYALSVFWLGDSMGVYIFTPLLVVWAIQKPSANILHYSLDFLGMLIAFFLLSYLTLVYYNPMWHLFIPLAVWVTYRFGMHGATIAMFLITIAAVIPFSLGLGSFHTLLVKTPLLILVSFLETIVATSLVLAAALNEREAALNFIRKDHLNLRSTVQETKEELTQMHNSMFIKMRFVSALDRLAIQMSKHINLPLTSMNKFITNSVECVKQIKKKISEEKLDEESAAFYDKYIHFLEESLQNINNFQSQADKIAKIIQEQSVLATRGTELVQKISVNSLLEACLSEIQESAAKRYPDFKFEIIKEFDPFVAKILMLPEDLAHALIIFMNQAIEALKAKEKHLIEYKPELKIKTIYQIDSLSIIIDNNGLNDPESLPKYFSQSFFVPKNLKFIPEESLALNLALAHDIIAHVHQGSVTAQIFENQHLELTITLPIEAEF